MSDRFSKEKLLLFCEKNSDGTKILRLKGKDLKQRFGRRLHSFDMCFISIFLKDQPSVTTLDFCYNHVRNEGIMNLVTYLFSVENNIEHLNLMYCDLTTESVGILNNAKYLNLKTLRLNGNKLGPQSADALGKLLTKYGALEFLDIAETDQTFDSISKICYFAENSGLKVLDISRVVPKNCVYVTNPLILANDIGYLLDKNKSLTELHLQKCDFDGHDMELLLYGLKTNKQLVMLNIGCNHIGNYGAEILANWLKTGPNLKALNISYNSIGEIGARALSICLPSSHLKLLDISYNKINDIGMNHVLFSIKKAIKMRILFMWGNPIGEKTNQIIDRLLKCGVFEQANIDVKVYYVDGVACSAYYPTNHYKHKYYCVVDYGCSVDIKIKRNVVAGQCAKPKAVLDLTHYDRYPPIDCSLNKQKKRSPFYCEGDCFKYK